ncbi:MAG TPA: heparan-alpha-glucosaminide N-acetyltransferase domain-containing protein [Terriglobales bacterium]
MATISNPSAVISAVPVASGSVRTQPQRLVSVDLLRGLIMVIMALDHVRDYFTSATFQPEDLSRTNGVLFLTRFITHFCAPTFALLAGTGAYLAVSRGKSVQEVSRFFWTRGLWLVFLEFTVVGFAWTFSTPYAFALVIWSLGVSMILMAALVRLPVRWIAVFGIVMIVGHNLLDGISPDSLGKFSWLWTILHSPGMVMIKPPDFGVEVLYALVPWVGVMACGYALGAVLTRPDHRKLVLQIGIGLTLAFFILRGINLYGNGTAGYPFSIGPWKAQSSLTLTLISFFNTQKYPPSLDYLLMTLGPALIVLSLFNGVKAERGVGRFLLVFGRVPMFYYLLHIYLVHSMAIVVAWLSHQPAAWLWHGAVFLNRPPDGWGFGLPFIYFIWALAIAILYLPCRWYMEFKRQHRDWAWLSYV